ncbi:MAG TPA: hypothetical protein VKA27_03265 [Sunxiuqinia sp.]|nr:hypothetical protein [Sunxiuqinia sp.]
MGFGEFHSSGLIFTDQELVAFGQCGSSLENGVLPNFAFENGIERRAYPIVLLDINRRDAHLVGGELNGLSEKGWVSVQDHTIFHFGVADKTFEAPGSFYLVMGLSDFNNG